ncbi:MAG TPA: amidohydrolase family protein [Steroidobacter sp.]|nr:amidohydrolase family protein [Steroidobacter sp.]
MGDSGQSVPGASLCLPPSPVKRALRTPLARDACDCHFHVFAPEDQFPLVSARGYTPHPCSYETYRAAATGLGIERAVLVQPSVYGYDNALLVETLRSDRARLRGIAVIAPNTSIAQLTELHEAGVRGLRINLCQPGLSSLTDIGVLGPKIAKLGWHFQLHLDISQVAGLESIVRNSAVPIVIDHFGMISSRATPSALESLGRLLATRRCWFKLTAPYRCGTERPPYPEVTPLARSLIEHHSDRLVWGTDWPHPGLHSHMPDDTDLADLLDDWGADTHAREQILVHNPNTLYWHC